MVSLTPEKIMEMLNHPDSIRSYNERVNWAIGIPPCSLYDGERICPVWRDWINKGRSLYDKGEKSTREYIQKVQQRIPRLGENDIRNILEND